MDCPCVVPSSVSASKCCLFRCDRAAFDVLISRSSIRDAQRLAQRLRRLDVPHANAWISALPSAVDSSDTVMPRRVYLTCVRRLLGLPVLSSPIPCPLCKQADI